MNPETYILYGKGAHQDKSFWMIEEIVIPSDRWTNGWEQVIEYLKEQKKIDHSGTYAVQNKYGRGFCVFSVEFPNPKPKPVITIL